MPRCTSHEEEELAGARGLSSGSQCFLLVGHAVSGVDLLLLLDSQPAPLICWLYPVLFTRQIRAEWKDVGGRKLVPAVRGHALRAQRGAVHNDLDKRRAIRSGGKPAVSSQVQGLGPGSNRYSNRQVEEGLVAGDGRLGRWSPKDP